MDEPRGQTLELKAILVVAMTLNSEYAIEKCKRRRGEIRLVNADGEIEETIPFDDRQARRAG